MTHTLRSLAHRAIASSSDSGYTPPVGFDGELMMMPRTEGSYFASRSAIEARNPLSSDVGTITASARASLTSAGYDVQYGAGIRTLSPGPNRKKHALNRACLAPVETTTPSAVAGCRVSVLIRSAMA